MATCTETNVRHVQLEDIRIDGGTQCRIALNEETVKEYSELIVGDFEFPPAIVYFDGSVHWMADGFHRYFAYQKAHYEAMPCEIREGTKEDAQWASFGANKSHGLRRSNADKQRAVELALKHPNAAGMSNVLIASHVGVDEKTIRTYREKLEATSEVPKSDKRKGKNGLTQKTASDERSKSQKRRIAEQQGEPTAETAREPAPAASPASDPPSESAETTTPEPAQRGGRSLPKLYELFDDLLGKLVRCIDDLANAGGGADKFTNKAHQALNLVKSNINDHKRAHR